MQYFRHLYPSYDYLFLGDTEHNPYGEKSAEMIKTLTFAWLQWLFDQWCQIVILACHTASAYAIRDWQKQFPRKKVLPVSVPGVEKMWSVRWDAGCKMQDAWKALVDGAEFVVLCSKAMSVSGIYEDLYQRMWGERREIVCVDAQKLVALAEDGECDSERVEAYIRDVLFGYCDDSQDKTLVLWCTLFPIFWSLLEKYWKWNIVDPGREAGKSFGDYVRRHKEICLQKGSWEVRFCVTGDGVEFTRVVQLLLWKRIDVESIYYTL